MVPVINIRRNIDYREAVLFSVEKKENDRRGAIKNHPPAFTYLGG